MLVKEFRQILNKGLGSAIVFLKTTSNNLKKYHNTIVYSCTHNTAYDAQCEGSRAEYLWNVIQFSGDSKGLQDKVIMTLPRLDDGYEIQQIYELSKYFIQAGNIKALEVLKQEFKYHKTWNCFIGVEEIIEIEGENGFLFVAEKIGLKLLFDSEYFEDDVILDSAIEKLGKDKVFELLEKSSQTNKNIKAYFEAVKKFVQDRKAYERKKIETYEDVKELINSKDSNRNRYMLRRWGLIAYDEDLQKIAQELLSEKEKRKLISYLYVFSKRVFPLNIDKLLELAEASNEDMSSSAIMALSNIQDVRIHHLATKLIQKNSKHYETIDLFIKNYTKDDHIVLESMLSGSSNKHYFHNIGMSLLDIYEVNDTAECLNIMVKIYKQGYCSLCRERCVEIMIKNRILPEWIMNEALYDCRLRRLLMKLIESI